MADKWEQGTLNEDAQIQCREEAHRSVEQLLALLTDIHNQGNIRRGIVWRGHQMGKVWDTMLAGIRAAGLMPQKTPSSEEAGNWVPG